MSLMKSNILYMENKIDDAGYETLKKVIPSRFKASEGFKSKEARDAFLLGRYLTVNDLNCKEEDIYCNSYGKPYCKNKDFFNVSHTGDYIVYVRSEDKIGIDIEKIDKRLFNIIDYAFTEDEIKYIRSTTEPSAVMYRATLLWTIKESLFKASGLEKGIEPKDIETCDSDVIEFEGEKYNIRHLHLYENIITVASKIKYDDLELCKVEIKCQ